MGYITCSSIPGSIGNFPQPSGGGEKADGICYIKGNLLGKAQIFFILDTSRCKVNQGQCLPTFILLNHRYVFYESAAFIPVGPHKKSGLWTDPPTVKMAMACYANP